VEVDAGKVTGQDDDMHDPADRTYPESQLIPQEPDEHVAAPSATVGQVVPQAPQ
jgi:hypothetical protein